MWLIQPILRKTYRQTWQMLDALSADQREIVHLKIYCELTFAEISDVLQIPIGTAAWRYQSAVKKLRKLYGEVL